LLPTSAYFGKTLLTITFRLEKEQLAWKSLLKPTKSKPATQTQQPIDSSLLNPSQASLLAYLDTSQSAASSSASSTTNSKLSSEVSSRIEALTSNLEPTVNAFADGIHRISQYNVSAARVADRVKSIMAQRLEKRSEEARRHGGNGEVGGRDVLRALAVKLNEK
jgi:kinetochore protein Mis13/DSN1